MMEFSLIFFNKHIMSLIFALSCLLGEGDWEESAAVVESKVSKTFV